MAALALNSFEFEAMPREKEAALAARALNSFEFLSGGRKAALIFLLLPAFLAAESAPAAAAAKQARAGAAGKNKPQKKPQNNRGFSVPPVKKTDVLARMGLKKDDVIQNLNGKPVSSKKSFLKRLRRMRFKRGFSLELERGSRRLRFVYRKSGKGQFRLSKRAAIKSRAKIAKRGRGGAKKSRLRAGSRLPASAAPAAAGHSKKSAAGHSKKSAARALKKTAKKPKKSSNKKAAAKKKPKKNSWAKKHRRILQNGLVTAPRALIYEKPSFDSKQIYALPAGEPVIMSKKIVRPPHRFGSFYKVFITEPRKVVGYISEIEAEAEFVKRGGKYLPNPRYKKAARQISAEGAESMYKLADGASPRQEDSISSLPPPARGGKRRYVGFSAGAPSLSVSQPPAREDFHFGLKFSGYNLLISSWNMDYNLSLSLFNPYYLHGDILTGYPLLRGMRFYIYLLAGLQLNVDINAESRRQPKVSPGMLGALSLFAPFGKRLIFRADLMGGCEFYDCRTTLLPGGRISAQIGF